MDILVVDTAFNTIDVLDSYTSLVWTERYNSYGDFEIYVKPTKQLFDTLKADYYLWSKESKAVMIIEDHETVTDIEGGNDLLITGRSLESILERRYIPGQKTLTGSVQTSIQTLINECIISAVDADRRISGFTFQVSTDPKITSLTADLQFENENLLDVIETVCMTFSIGFRITLSDTNKFIFELYAGENRTYDQEAHPYVVFSPSFDNIVSSNYIESKKLLKTFAYIGGEGEGTGKIMTSVVVASGGGTGLNRREMYVDASSVSSNNGEISPEAYLLLLQQKGIEELANNEFVQVFDGETESNYMYKYGEDYNMGDVVQIANEYGHETHSRVVEYIWSENDSGLETYPTFLAV